MFIEWLEKMVDGIFALIPRSKPHPVALSKARLIAHRGVFNNKKGVFENTHAAFRLAMELGCWGIELDVHRTADGFWVVNHDPTLARLWGRPEAIADLSFSQLRQLVPGVPSLQEVGDAYAHSMHLFIELKVPLLDEAPLFDMLKAYTPCQDYHLITLDASIFNAIKQFPKDSLLLVAAHNNVKAFCALSIKEGYGGVLGNYLLLSQKRILQLKKAHQVYGVGFIDSKNSLFRELNRGGEWIFTNQAEAIIPNVLASSRTY